MFAEAQSGMSATLGGLPLDIWLTLLPFLEPPDLLSVSLLNHTFYALVQSHRNWKEFSGLFPAHARSIRAPWHEIAWIHKASLARPIRSATRIGDFPRCVSDIDCYQQPHCATLSSTFFNGDRSKRVLASVSSRLRAYHRALWRSRRFGHRLCRIWHTRWDASYDACEHRMFHFPPEMVAPAGFHTWGDFVMWKEEKRDSLSVVTVEGLTIFTRESSFKERAARRLCRLLRPSRHRDWYSVMGQEINEGEEPPSPPPRFVLNEMSLNVHLSLYNVFDGTRYTIPLRALYEATIHLGEHCALYLHDVVEHTLCDPFLCIFQIHNRTTEENHLMSWNVLSATPNWISDISEAVIGHNEWAISRFKFGNALFGYLAEPLDRSFRYHFHDIATGKLIQAIPLDRFRDPTLETMFYCHFTSFFFLAWSPQAILNRYVRSPLNPALVAPISVYHITTGKMLYTLDCPMRVVTDLIDVGPIIPWFKRTDESERYWIFQAPNIIRSEIDPVNTIFVWDVVEQEWHILVSECTERQEDTVVYQDEEGRLKMAQLDPSPSDPIRDEESAWARYRWNRIPSASEARKLKRIRIG